MEFRRQRTDKVGFFYKETGSLVFVSYSFTPVDTQQIIVNFFLISELCK